MMCQLVHNNIFRIWIIIIEHRTLNWLCYCSKYSNPLAETENWVVVFSLIVWLIKHFPMGTWNSLLSMNILFSFCFWFSWWVSNSKGWKGSFLLLLLWLFGQAKSEWSILMSWLWSPVCRMHLWSENPFAKTKNGDKTSDMMNAIDDETLMGIGIKCSRERFFEIR